MIEMNAREKAMLASRFALEKKSYDLVLLEVRELTSIADYFVVCSGRSDRQVQSIAQGIEENFRAMGVRPQSVEGAARGQWALLDFSDVIVHVFYQPAREFYDLEGLWIDAPRVALPEPYATMAQQLRIRDEQRL